MIGFLADLIGDLFEDSVIQKGHERAERSSMALYLFLFFILPILFVGLYWLWSAGCFQ